MCKNVWKWGAGACPKGDGCLFSHNYKKFTAEGVLKSEYQATLDDDAWPQLKAKAKAKAKGAAQRSASMPVNVPKPAGYEDYQSDPSFFRLNLENMSAASASDEDRGNALHMSHKEGFGTVEVFASVLEAKHDDYKAQGAARKVFSQSQMAYISALKNLNGNLTKELPWNTVLDDGSKKSLRKERS